MAASTVRVRGLSELNRALKNIDKDLAKEIRDALKDAGEEVRQEAENLARSRISRIDARWSAMRVGATNRVVYVAPRARRRGGSGRPNFGIMLLEEAMIPALEQHQAVIVHKLEATIDRLGARNGF